MLSQSMYCVADFLETLQKSKCHYYASFYCIEKLVLKHLLLLGKHT